MSGEFKPEDFTDSFKTQVLALVARKAKAGKTHAVIEPEEETPASGGADIIDLTELLKRSLKGDKAGEKPARGKAAAKRSRAA
jgi:DNA end-binding protein Ku